MDTDERRSAPAMSAVGVALLVLVALLAAACTVTSTVAESAAPGVPTVPSVAAQPITTPIPTPIPRPTSPPPEQTPSFIPFDDDPPESVDLGALGTLGTGPALDPPPGHEALTFELPYERAVGGNLYPGAMVTIIVHLPEEADSDSATFVLGDVELLQTMALLDPEQAADPFASAVAIDITIAVEPAEAAVVSNALDRGEITLSTKLSNGQQAIALALPAHRALTGLVQPESAVAVLYQPAGASSDPTVLLSDARVLNVSATLEPSDGLANDYSVILEVAASDLALLVEATTSGYLSLALQ